MMIHPRGRPTRLDRLAAILYGLPPLPRLRAQVAQLVEHATENRSVGGSIPPLGTIPSSAIATGDLQAMKQGCPLPTFPPLKNADVGDMLGSGGQVATS